MYAGTKEMEKGGKLLDKESPISHNISEKTRPLAQHHMNKPGCVTVHAFVPPSGNRWDRPPIKTSERDIP